MTELARFSADAPVEKLLEALRRDGALILEDVLPGEIVEQALAELMPFVDATKPGADDFSGKATTRTGALVARSEVIRDCVMHPLVLEAARAFLAPFCERIQLHLSQVIRIGPGQPAQMIHRDRWAWGAHLAHVEPQLNTIWALSDFRRENGATQVVPGSLDWPDDRRPQDDEIAYAEMNAGSLLLYTGGVFHGGGENASNGDRIGVNLTYTLGWLRQEENQYLACPPEIARDLPRELQDLLGYAQGGYALGYYTPPMPAGEGPELVSPGFSLGQSEAGSELGSEELRDNLEKALVAEAAAARERSG